MEAEQPRELHALVDMGSNGIRFSISDLTRPTARILPTVYQDRAGISLHDAQFRQGSDARHPILEDVQNDVISHLLRFKKTCQDFGVSESNITVLATQATRQAPDSAAFRDRIMRATGWEVRMLSPQEEGIIGAFGVASSLTNASGLVMDLGGGSIQISWIDTSQDGVARTNLRGSISLPYGAAELKRRFDEQQAKGDTAIDELGQEILDGLRNAFGNFGIPINVIQRAEEQGGINLYLTGGGFRAWGFFCMSHSRVNPYPIPVVNGFKVDKEDFYDSAAVMNFFSQAITRSKFFRVSQRRASQIPAISFLVHALMQALPTIKSVRFCQGGVREGFLLRSLPPEIQSDHPLLVATLPCPTSDTTNLSSLLQSALPVTNEAEEETPPAPSSLSPVFITSFSNVMYAHSAVPKDIRPAAALRCTTTGLLASAHGLCHEERALLALALYERWSGDLSPLDQVFLIKMRQIVSMEEAWWCKYLGRVAALVDEVYPGGVIPADETTPRISFDARLERKIRPKKGGFKRTVRLVARVDDDAGFIREAAQRIEKLGKKKNWIMAEERVERIEGGDWGLKVDVDVETWRKY